MLLSYYFIPSIFFFVRPCIQYFACCLLNERMFDDAAAPDEQ